MTDISNEYLRKFTTIFRGILLIVKHISDTNFRENNNAHFVSSKFFFPKIVPFMR